jgi:glycosyltransferase involved in cell wall biosynthesis
MKILRIIARLNVGGPARHVVWLTRELNDDEFRSSLIAGTVPDGEEDMAYLASENGIQPIFIPEMSRELSLNDVISSIKIYKEIRRQEPDIIHTHTAKAGTVGRLGGFLYRWLTWKTLVGKPRRIRVVHTFHGHVFHSYYGPLRTRIFILIEKLLAKFATDKIITITDQQFDEIHKRFGVGRQGQFEIIPLGIDLTAFETGEPLRKAFRKEIGAADNEIVVGYVGRLTEIKNIPLLLSAAARLAAVSDLGVPNIRFVVVGEGHLRKELEAQAASFGVSDAVSFLGNRNNVQAVYAGVDIVALTSLNEGTPLSLIEAMAACKPVISTMVGGVVDLIGKVNSSDEGFSICERGISIMSGSIGGLTNGLIYLAKDERLRRELGERGRAFAEAKYSKSRLVDDIKELYRRLV